MADPRPHAGPDARYRAFLEEGRFMLQRSRSTGGWVFYPRLAEPGTAAEDLEWMAPSGRGVVYAFTVISPKPPAEPYNVALIDLEEGPRMMSRVEAAPESLAIGMRVRAEVLAGDPPLVVFRPVDA